MEDIEDIDETMVEDLGRSTVVSIQCCVRTIVIPQNMAKICQLSGTTASIMSDTGANVCMAPDASKLVKVRDIDPVKVTLALESDTNQDFAYCRQMGYLPMPMANGMMHDQPFLINPTASDVIMSPRQYSNRQKCSTVLSRWDTKYKSNQPGTLRFLGDNVSHLMQLELFEDNDLYI